jgi:hypothetical protein
MPYALPIKFPGTNGDVETSRALESAGFSAEVLPISQLEPASLDKAQLVVFSGGFSYGDYVMSGRISQLITKHKLGDRLKKFVADGGYVPDPLTPRPRSASKPNSTPPPQKQFPSRLLPNVRIHRPGAACRDRSGGMIG